MRSRNAKWRRDVVKDRLRLEVGQERLFQGLSDEQKGKPNRGSNEEGFDQREKPGT